uniref:DDRGK domain-containing protein 1 n=1 Tax=Kryptolebias marmoratus TaxID=37003 RepID=A0A3Q3AKE0_KRYMA
MDVFLYVAAAAILVVLILFALKLQRKTRDADEERQRDVVRAAGAPPRAPEERGAGMPRRRRNLGAVMANRRLQRGEPDEEEAVEDEEGEQPNLQPAARVGAKKQKKLEEKQAKKAQREVMSNACLSVQTHGFLPTRLSGLILRRSWRRERRERGGRSSGSRRDDRKRSRRDFWSRNRRVGCSSLFLVPCEEALTRSVFPFRQEEQEQRAKEEQERQEEEEYRRLKASFVIEEQGEQEQLSEDQSRSLLQDFIQYIENSKVVLLEDLASHFGMRTQDAISRLQDLLSEGTLTGVIDDRGKFIFITPEELDSVARFIKQRGRVSITELAQASNSLINLVPESRSAA